MRIPLVQYRVGNYLKHPNHKCTTVRCLECSSKNARSVSWLKQVRCYMRKVKSAVDFDTKMMHFEPIMLYLWVIIILYKFVCGLCASVIIAKNGMNEQERGKKETVCRVSPHKLVCSFSISTSTMIHRNLWFACGLGTTGCPNRTSNYKNRLMFNTLADSRFWGNFLAISINTSEMWQDRIMMGRCAEKRVFEVLAFGLCRSTLISSLFTRWWTWERIFKTKLSQPTMCLVVMVSMSAALDLSPNLEMWFMGLVSRRNSYFIRLG